MHALAAFTEHGGRVAAARARFGGEDWIDLSTGIAPWAYPAGGIDPAFDRLPDPAALAALETAAAVAFGVDDPAGVMAVPGTDLAMRLLAGLIGAEWPAVVEPGYAGHRAAWPDAIGVSEDLWVRSETDLLVLASPANPSGHVTDPASLSALAERMTVVLDQAYADPAPCPLTSDRLVVLRSFGKFYGLPGLRLGVVVAGPTIAARLRALLGDWPVSSAAIAIGTAAYRDVAWRAAQAARIDAMAHRLDGVLAHAGLSIRGRAPLFRLVETDDAAGLFERLAHRAILTRPFADEPRWLRIGLPCDERALTRFASALEDADD